jgi:hypothetical protein
MGAKRSAGEEDLEVEDGLLRKMGHQLAKKEMKSSPTNQAHLLYFPNGPLSFFPLFYILSHTSFTGPFVFYVI